MPDPHRPTTPRPIDVEAPFDLADLFFSTTDPKGFITFGNDVFVHVSKYPRETLIGAPHRIIRHPQMPRIVFKLLWETLHAGKGISAYVKNMAADGAFYWVLAIVTPVEGGYLSIRLKPSSDFFKPIADVYARLHATESDLEAAGESKFRAMESSGAALNQALRSLGFEGYEAFQHSAVVNEICARRAALGGRPHANAGRSDHACRELATSMRTLVDQLETFGTLQRELSQSTGTIRQLATELQRLSLNAHIRAMHLHTDGTTLEVVADHMNRSSRSLGSSAAALERSMAQTDAMLMSARSAIAVGDVSVEMMTQFLAEQTDASHADLDHRIRQLSQVVASRIGDASDAAHAVSQTIARLSSQLESFRKEVQTLEILHITGKAEAMRVPSASHVSMIFDEVNSATRQARRRLDGLIELLERVTFAPPDARRIGRQLAAIAVAA